VRGEQQRQQQEREPRKDWNAVTVLQQPLRGAPRTPPQPRREPVCAAGLLLLERGWLVLLVAVVAFKDTCAIG